MAIVRAAMRGRGRRSLRDGLERFQFESTQERAASLGDNPSLISWRPFCAVELKDDPKRGRRRRRCASRTLDCDILPRLAPAKKSMQESGLNSLERFPGERQFIPPNANTH